MSKVYVVNYSGHNIEASLSYGKSIYLTQNSVNIFCTDRIKEEFHKDLRSFNYKEDYILLSGSIILNILAVLEALRVGPRVNVLIYNFKTSKYIVRTI
jgi:hypothetical protein